MIPEPDAMFNDTFTFKVHAGNTTFMLAETVLIKDIPEQQYITESTEEGGFGESESTISSAGYALVNVPLETGY